MTNKVIIRQRKEPKGSKNTVMTGATTEVLVDGKIHSWINSY